MNAPSVDIKDMLEAESILALQFKTDLFIGQEPSAPDDCVTIYDGPAGPPMVNEAYYYPSIQIRVRDRKYINAYNLAFAIMEALHGRHGETWNSTVYTAVICTGDPQFLTTVGERNLSVFIVNFNLQRRSN